jgi:Helix-turn-helix domain
MGACYEHLSYVDRLSIDEGRRSGLSLRAIARKLNRAPSTVSRDVRRMGPYQSGYDAPTAFFGALYRRVATSRTGTKVISSWHTQPPQHPPNLKRQPSKHETSRTKATITSGPKSDLHCPTATARAFR